MVEALEPVLPGMGRLIFGALVPALAMHKSVQELAPQVRFGLPFNVKFILDSAQDEKSAGAPLSLHQQLQIFRAHSLAGIACHWFGVRESLARSDADLAFSCATWLVRTLILGWAELSRLRIAVPVCNFAECALLPAAANEFGWRWSVSPAVIDQLHRHLIELCEANGSATNLNSVAFGILTGKLGAPLMVQCHSGLLQRANHFVSDEELSRVLTASRQLVGPPVLRSGSDAAG
jgi:hypothetical protein